jgi:hypothetical protein
LGTGNRVVLTCPAALRDATACRALIAAGADVNNLKARVVTRSIDHGKGELEAREAPLHVAESPEVVLAQLHAGASAAASSGDQGRSPLFSPAATNHPRPWTTQTGRATRP